MQTHAAGGFRGVHSWRLWLVGPALLVGCMGYVSDIGGDEDAPAATDSARRDAPVATLEDLSVYSRLTKQEYRYVVRDLLVGASDSDREEALGLVDAFNENNYSGYYKNYDPIAVYPGLERAQLALADALARAFVSSALFRRLCAGSSCVDNVADQLLPRIWKRRVEGTERQELADFYGSFPPDTRHRYFFLRLFASPYFHYKIFAQSPRDADAADIKKAQLLSFAITGSYPDDRLQADVDSGALLEPSRWEEHITRLLQEHPDRFATLFVPQWLGMASSYESDDRYHGVPLSTVMTEPALIFADVLENDRPISSLFTRDSSVVSPQLAALYDGVTTPTLFGTAAMSYLTVDHESENPSPIRRGSYIVNHLLCRKIEFPPSEVQAEVDRVVSNAPEGLSPPERMAYFRSHTTCASCHEQFDPYGLALEEIGIFGQFRNTYYTGDPVEASGVVGDITYSSSVDFARQLAEAPELNTCFASQVYSYLSSSPHVSATAALREHEAEMVGMSASEIISAMLLRALGEGR